MPHLPCNPGLERILQMVETRFLKAGLSELESVVQRLVASPSPGALLEMEIHAPLPDLLNQGAQDVCFSRPPRRCTCS